jgi:magnesium transporter
MSAATTTVDDLALEFVAKYPDDAARALQDLGPDDVAAIVERSRAIDAARLIGRLGPDTASRVLARLPAGAAQAVLALADPEVATACLRRLSGEIDLAAVLSSLPAPRRHEVQSLLNYPENSAGSLMDPAAPVFREDTRVAEVAAALAESHRYSDQTVTVVGGDGRLLGTLSTVQALLADPVARLASLGVQNTLSVDAFAHRDEVADLIDERRLSAIPVVDRDQRPVGLLNLRALAKVAEQDAVADMQSMVGASRDEHALSNVGFAVRKRLPWLQINLATAFLAAAVVGLFEATIAQFTALAVLLPVVAGQSGNTGAQSLAVTMRGLTLHEIGLRHWLRVVTKESTVGLVNGLAVAVVTMAGVYVWSRSLGLCTVIGLAMVMSMTIAGVAGAGVPLVLRASGQDPAQSSSIVLTTVTDITGFFSFLGLASFFASWL